MLTKGSSHDKDNDNGDDDDDDDVYGELSLHADVGKVHSGNHVHAVEGGTSIGHVASTGDNDKSSC